MGALLHCRIATTALTVEKCHASLARSYRTRGEGLSGRFLRPRSTTPQRDQNIDALKLTGRGDCFFVFWVRQGVDRIS